MLLQLIQQKHLRTSSLDFGFFFKTPAYGIITFQRSRSNILSLQEHKAVIHCILIITKC